MWWYFLPINIIYIWMYSSSDPDFLETNITSVQKYNCTWRFSLYPHKRGERWRSLFCWFIRWPYTHYYKIFDYIIWHVFNSDCFNSKDQTISVITLCKVNSTVLLTIPADPARSSTSEASQAFVSSCSVESNWELCSISVGAAL